MAARQSFSVQDVLGAVLDEDGDLDVDNMDEFCFDGSDDEVSNYDGYDIFIENILSEESPSPAFNLVNLVMTTS